MRLVIESEDFRRLSPDTQRELIRLFAGKEFVAAREPPRRQRFNEKRPVDLDAEITRQLMSNLSGPHRKRLELFATKGGKVTMKQMLKVTGDRDPRVISYFLGVVTRKLRRIIGDDEKNAFLIGWDFDSTVWNRDHTRIVDGVYCVSDRTVRSLRAFFRLG